MTASTPAEGARPPVNASEWEWFGQAAHLIVGRWCQFHMATVVNGYLVSTVGEYWPPRTSREIHAEVHDPTWLRENRHRKGDDFDNAYMIRFGYETVGYDRTYETMVFVAGTRCERPDCGCCLPEISGSELDFAGYNNAGEARAGHMALCAKYAAEPAASSLTPANAGEFA